MLDVTSAIHAVAPVATAALVPPLLYLITNLVKQPLTDGARNQWTPLISLVVGIGVASLALFLPEAFAILGLATGSASGAGTFHKRTKRKAVKNVSHETKIDGMAGLATNPFIPDVSHETLPALKKAIGPVPVIYRPTPRIPAPELPPDEAQAGQL